MSKRSIQNELKPEKLTYDFMRKAHNIPKNGFSDIYWVSANIIEELKPKNLK